jgi:hypothetical protein
MNCSGCNAELKAGAATCLECGKAVDATAGSPGASPAPGMAGTVGAAHIPGVSQVGSRTFVDYVKLAVRIVQLDEAAILDAARDPDATIMAVAFVAIAGLAPAIGSLSIITLLFTVPVMLMISAILIGIVHVFARMMGGKAQFLELYRAQGLSHLVGWGAAVPLLGAIISPFLGIFYAVLMVNNVKTVHRMPLTHAIAVAVLPMLVIGAALAVTALFGMGFILARLGRTHF